MKLEAVPQKEMESLFATLDQLHIMVNHGRENFCRLRRTYVGIWLYDPNNTGQSTELSHGHFAISNNVNFTFPDFQEELQEIIIYGVPYLSSQGA